MYHNFCIHLCVSGHRGGLYVLAIVKSAAMNTGVHESLSVMVFSGYMARSGMLGSHGSSIPRFFKEYPCCSPLWLYQFDGFHLIPHFVLALRVFLPSYIKGTQIIINNRPNKYCIDHFTNVLNIWKTLVINRGNSKD